DEASERLQRLQALITRDQRAIQDEMVGREVKVLIEKPGRLPGQMSGKSQYLHAVHIENCSAARGEIVTARIIESSTNSLAGELAG
ncbi:MAG: TRAM domain-containing protein, partial [Pseudomonadota bacterium]